MTKTQPLSNIKITNSLPSVQQYDLAHGAKSPAEAALLETIVSNNKQTALIKQHSGGSKNTPLQPGKIVVPQAPTHGMPEISPVGGNSNATHAAGTLTQSRAHAEFDIHVGKNFSMSGGGDNPKIPTQPSTQHMLAVIDEEILRAKAEEQVIINGMKNAQEKEKQKKKNRGGSKKRRKSKKHTRRFRNFKGGSNEDDARVAKLSDSMEKMRSKKQAILNSLDERIDSITKHGVDPTDPAWKQYDQSQASYDKYYKEHQEAKEKLFKWRGDAADVGRYKMAAAKKATTKANFDTLIAQGQVIGKGRQQNRMTHPPLVHFLDGGSKRRRKSKRHTRSSSKKKRRTKKSNTKKKAVVHQKKSTKKI